MKRVAIIGLGWLGLPLAEQLAAEGWQVKGSKRQAICHPNIEVIPLDLNTTPSPSCLHALLAVDAVVLNIPPTSLGEGYLSAIKHIVEQILLQQVKQLIFISTTGVFPAISGRFNEQSATDPNHPTAQLEQWLHQQPIACDILRLGGLIGANRHPVYHLAGKQNLTGAHQPVNLVHQADCIQAIRCLLARPNGRRLFHLVAPKHPTRQHYYSTMARQLGLADLHFLADNSPLVRLICGEHITQTLGFQYQFPDPFTMPIKSSPY